MPRLPDPKVIVKGPTEGMEEVRSSFQDTLKELGLNLTLPRLPGTKAPTNGKGGQDKVTEFIKSSPEAAAAPASSAPVVQEKVSEAGLGTEQGKEYSTPLIPLKFD